MFCDSYVAYGRKCVGELFASVSGCIESGWQQCKNAGMPVLAFALRVAMGALVIAGLTASVYVMGNLASWWHQAILSGSVLVLVGCLAYKGCKREESWVGPHNGYDRGMNKVISKYMAQRTVAKVSCLMLAGVVIIAVGFFIPLGECWDDGEMAIFGDILMFLYYPFVYMCIYEAYQKLDMCIAEKLIKDTVSANGVDISNMRVERNPLVGFCTGVMFSVYESCGAPKVVQYKDGKFDYFIK